MELKDFIANSDEYIDKEYQNILLFHHKLWNEIEKIKFIRIFIF